MPENLVVTNPSEAGKRSVAVRRRKKQEAIEAAEARLAEVGIPGATTAYLDALEAEAKDPAAHSVRIAAADRIWNRLVGMPKQSVEHSGVIEHDVGAARDRLSELLDRQAAQHEPIIEGESARIQPELMRSNSVDNRAARDVDSEPDATPPAPPHRGLRVTAPLRVVRTAPPRPRT